MTRERARELLGKKANSYSDDQLDRLLVDIRKIAVWTIEKIDAGEVLLPDLDLLE